MLVLGLAAYQAHTAGAQPAPGPLRECLTTTPFTAKLDDALRAGVEADVRLFDDARFKITVTTCKHDAAGGAWFGTVPDVPGSSVTFVERNGAWAGVIRAGTRGTYDLCTTDGRTWRVRQLDAAALATCGAGLSPAEDDHLMGPRGAATAAGVGHRCEDGSVIDVLVVYTAAARAAAGGTAAIEAQIALAVADANAAFTRSLVNTQVHLVHTAEVNYAETGIWETDAPRLVNPSDGYLDEVHPLREAYGADCVSLWVNNLDTGGIGYFPDATLTGIGNSGFSMLRLSNAGLLTFAHELGHNLFCAHDRPNAPDPPYADYSFGYVEPGGAWQTIMAVSPTAYIPYFANPNVDWPGPNPPNPGPTGVPIGAPLPSDVAATMNITRYYVANFRAPHIAGLAPVLHVNASAAAGGDGASWATAFDSLSDALCAAAGSNGAVQEIWVAAGTYLPADAVEGRYATFRLVNGVSVLGGFAGDEVQRTRRDPVGNVTILSGDRGSPGDAGDNCYHVVMISANDATAVLDGFTITNGYADGDAPNDNGGGLFAYDGGNATVRNCTLFENTAFTAGGAVYLGFGAAATFEQCTLRNNTALSDVWPAGGGGLHAYSNCAAVLSDCAIYENYGQSGAGLAWLFDSTLTLTRCTVHDNIAPIDGQGGGLYGYAGAGGTFNACTIRDNLATYGGGLAAYFNSAPTFENCRWLRNTADNDGGGVYLYSASNVAMTNVVFAGNTASYGGALNCLFDSAANLTNCTLVGNAAVVAGGGLYAYQSTPELHNTLLWQNVAGGVPGEDGQLYAFDSVPLLNHCSVQGWTGAFGGVANNGVDPAFIDANGLDNVFGTLDDNVHLAVGSPAIDTGDNAAVPPGVTTDPDGRPRIVAGIVDRGAYEYARPGDFDGDGLVDAADCAHFANCMTGPDFTPQPLPPATDANCVAAFDGDHDGDVDLRDLAGFQAAFGQP